MLLLVRLATYGTESCQVVVPLLLT